MIFLQNGIYSRDISFAITRWEQSFNVWIWRGIIYHETIPIVNAFRGVHAVMSPESGRWCTMKAQRAWMVHHLPDEGDITCMYTEKCIDNDFVTFKLDLPVHSGTSPPFWMTSLPLANELLPKQSCDQNKNMCSKMVVMYNCVRGVHQYL